MSDCTCPENGPLRSSTLANIGTRVSSTLRYDLSKHLPRQRCRSRKPRSQSYHSLDKWPFPICGVYRVHYATRFVREIHRRNRLLRASRTHHSAVRTATWKVLAGPFNDDGIHTNALSLSISRTSLQHLPPRSSFLTYKVQLL